jgi:hypothetical protein
MKEKPKKTKQQEEKKEVFLSEDFLKAASP